MKKSNYVSANKFPLGFRTFLITLMFSSCILITNTLDKDFYFLYSFGKYISFNGFPTKDILSLHADMNIIVQQWLTDILFYHSYELFGQIGVLTIVHASLVAYIILFYKLCMYISDNFLLSVLTTLFSSIPLAVMFMVSRPQIFSYIIFVLLLFCLEKYIKTQRKGYLCVLPLLSLLQINLHASMWLMLFILMLPYLVSCINYNFSFYKEPSKCKFIDLLLTMIAMIATAFINPYGSKSLLYLFGSYGLENLNLNIREMRATTITEIKGLVYFCFVFLMILLFIIYKERSINLRFICLWLGTTVLGLTSYKANAYFYIIGFVASAYFFENFDFPLKVLERKRTKNEKRRLALLISLVTISTIYLILSMPETKEKNEGIQDISPLEPSVAYLDTQNKNDMSLYAGFNEGSFLEFHGYKPYMDGRAELFLKSKNGEFDYFTEYLCAESGKIYYKDFLDKYDFTHILVPTGDNHLYISISHDNDYQIGYTDENYTVFIPNN